MKLIASYQYDCKLTASRHFDHDEGITLVENLYQDPEFPKDGFILGTYYQGPNDQTEEVFVKGSSVMAKAWARIRNLELELPT